MNSLSHNVFGPRYQLPATCKSQTVLIQEFDNRKTLASYFPPVFADNTVRASIKRYQAKIAATKSHFIHVCASCGLFIALDAVKIIHTLDVLFQRAIECGVFVQASLDLCACIEESYSLCGTCFNSIKKLKSPKFGLSNLVNTVPCQLYPKELEGFTSVEEVFIARAHPVILILKLHSSKSSIAVSYQWVRGHAVMFSQNPEPLLDLLSSDTLILYDVIRIVWARDRPHTAADIQPFATVQREKILTALCWLKENNVLYRNIVINTDLLQQWEDEFVPSGIAEHVVDCGKNNSKKQSYGMDLKADNFEDNFHAAASQAQSENTKLSGCVYTDANQICEHPTSKLISALVNNKVLSTDSNEQIHVSTADNLLSHEGNGNGPNPPLIIYQSKGCAVSLNDWDNPAFFTAAFPTLFPFGTGGHFCRTKKTALSIETWAKWALTHHLRRWVA